MSWRPRAFVICVATVAMMGVVCPWAMGLNPALDVSQYAHTGWKIRDGFTKGAITSIAQTPDGYLWLGTEFGLYRFDGVRAVAWQPPTGQKHPNDYVLSLLVSRDGTLWIGIRGGLASWRGETLKQYPQLADISFFSLLEDREGTVWAVGEVLGSSSPQSRLCALHDGQVQCYGEGGPFRQWVEALYEDREGNLWVGGADGLWRWRPGAPQHYVSSPIARITEDENGTLVLSGREGLRKFVGGKIEPYALPGAKSEIPVRLLRSSDGNLWVGTVDRGLMHVHGGRTDWFEQSDGLTGNTVFAIFEDHEGNVWVGTNEGLDRFRDFAVPSLSSKQGLLDDGYSLVASSDGSVWIASAHGLSRWKDTKAIVYSWSRSNKVSALAGAPRSAMTTAEVVNNSGLPATPQSLFQDHLGQIWATTAKGIARWDGSRFVAVNGVPGDEVYAMAEDREGTVWIGSAENGLFRVPRLGGIGKTSWSQLGRREYATAMAGDPSQGGLWLGFARGGIAYWKDGQLRASYAVETGLGKGSVRHLRFGSRGTLWAATEGGLSRIRDGRIATLTHDNGLPCETVHWSVEDDDHFIWLYMPCGLVRVARSELDAWASNPAYVVQTAVYDITDGVRLTPVLGGYSPHVAKSTDGRIWFPTLAGLNVIDPRHLPVNKLAPPVQIEQITADHKTYDAASVASEKLPALLRDLEIDYTALSLVAPEKVRFRTKLEGWDSDWQDVGNRRQAYYSNLPPRHYKFRVLACNNSGVWNETGAALDFSIAPAYYQTSWFAFLCAAGFLGLLWAAYQMRLRQVTEQVRHRMEGRLEERERIARDLHDTLLQSVQGLILKFHAVSKQCDEPVRQAIEKTLDHADEVMAEGRDRVRNLRATAVPLSDLSAAFRRVADETAPGREAMFKVVVEGKARDLNPMILEESFSIGREALSNALIHSGGHNVEVEITYDARQFRLRINDDGRGVDPEVLEKGGRAGHWGLPGMRERARKMGGQLQFWSRPGTGTEVELKVPAATAYSAKRATSKGFWFGRALDRLRGRYE